MVNVGNIKIYIYIIIYHTWILLRARDRSLYSQLMIGGFQSPKSKVFRFHYHSQKVIGCLAKVIGS